MGNNMAATGLVAVALIISTASCSSQPSKLDPDVTKKQEYGGETYSEYDERRDSLNGVAGAYEGDDCTEDCSGHEAGYEWAAENEIDDPDDCGGRSWSFIEGCQAYAEEQ